MTNSLTTKKTLIQLFSSVFLIVLSIPSLSQGFRANHWAFASFNGLDFSSGTPVTYSTSCTGSMGTSAISDLNGDLIFYSNGNKVWEAGGAVMSGGTGLVGDPQATQSSLIVPATISSTRYYLFVNDANAGPNGFQYYDVEMTLNGGNGGVVGPTMLLDSATEKMAATRHGNDKGYWVVAHKWESDEFHAFLVDDNGVNTTPVISAIGIEHLNSSGSGEETGQMKISPDGSWLATCNFSSGYVQLFRFNNTTGVLTDPITLASGNSVFPFGVEFSADSKKLFYGRRVSSGSNPAGIHQFDLDHASVDCLLASETIVSNNNPFKLYTDLQLANDKKIYVSYFKPSPFNADTLGVIGSPEEMCPDCGYIDNHLLTDSIIFSGVTNFVSSFMSDGITYSFGTNCENDTTWFMPEDTIGLDSVRWNFGDPSTGSANISTDLNAGHVFSNAPDTFQVTLFAYRGALGDTFTRNIIIWDTAVNLIGPDTTMCSGQSITFDATWYDACVLWEDGSTNNSYTTNQAGWHSVEIFHQSCVWTDSVQVTLVSQPPQFTLGNDTSVCADVNFIIDPDLPNAFYTWQDGSHDTSFAVSSTGTYWLQASNACGTSTDTLNVILNEAAQPVLNFPSDTAGCDTIGIELDVTFEGAVYTWNDGQTVPIRTITESGLYWVRVGNSCDTVSDTINIQIDAPIYNVLPDRDVTCFGDPSNPLILLASADSQSVNWSDGSVGPTLTVMQGAGTYWYSQSNQCGFVSDTVEVLSYDTNYIFTIGNDTTICSPLDTVIIGDAADDFPWTYRWNTGSSTRTIPVSKGFYQVEARLRCDTLVSNLNVFKAPRILITDSTTRTICQGDSLLFEVSTIEASSFTWSNGDLERESLITDPGEYFITVIDTFGCIHTDSVGLNDLCPGTVYIPNVFTPSSDGINDEFCLELTNILDFEFSIFTRWGSEVLYSSNQAQCWDGEINGTEALPGVYYYLLNATDAMGENTSFRGTFTLIRSH
ncbi:MAG: gliding motility-associated C-terminal domain-containing protein [Cryomorphaceae bacterium]